MNTPGLLSVKPTWKTSGCHLQAHRFPACYCQPKQTFSSLFKPPSNSLLITGILPPRDVELDQIHGTWKMHWVHGLLVRTSQGSCQMNILQHLCKGLYLFRRVKIKSNPTMKVPLQRCCVSLAWNQNGFLCAIVILQKREDVPSPSGRFSAKAADKEVSSNDISGAGYHVDNEARFSISNSMI